MLRQLRRLFRQSAKVTETAQPLLGTPAIRRVKTYAADTGYTWSYTFQGYRIETMPDGRSYVFSLWTGNRTPVEIAVSVHKAVIEVVARHAGREIESREWYALAKMHLFAVLDRESSLEARARFAIPEESALEIWERLGL